MEFTVMNGVLLVGLLLVVAYLAMSHGKRKNQYNAVGNTGNSEAAVFMVGADLQTLDRRKPVTGEEVATIFRNLNAYRQEEISQLREVTSQQFKQISRLEDKLNAMDERMKTMEVELHEVREENRDLRQRVNIMQQTIDGYDKARLHRIK